MNTPTTTSSSAASVSRITPSPICRYPYDSPLDNSICGNAYATSWGGCPADYTPACGSTVVVSTEFHVRTESHSLGPLSTLTLTKTETLLTNLYQMVCCPDLMPWVCASEETTATSCAFVASADTVFDLGRMLGAWRVTSAESLRGHGVTVTQALITSKETRKEIMEMVRSTTLWCDLPSCADLPSIPLLSWSETDKRIAQAHTQNRTQTHTQTHTPTSSPTPFVLQPPTTFVLQPPQEMGKVGSLGIFAVSGLAGAILFAAAVVGPWAVEYRKRKRQQLRA